MKLCNLKASFIFKKPIQTSKKVHNFIIRHAPFTFTIYHHSPCLVNVTGVKSLNQLTLAQETIERKLQQKVDNIRIDNKFPAPPQLETLLLAIPVGIPGPFFHRIMDNHPIENGGAGQETEKAHDEN